LTMRALQLETFTPAAPSLTRDSLSEAEAEEVKLAAYEKGYNAGWEDAAAAQDDDLIRLRNELGRNLQDLSFTYHEAHSHVLRTLEPLLKDMVGKVLPAIAREALGQVVLEHLRPLAVELATGPMEITTHPDNVSAVEDLVVEKAGFPVAVRGEPSLGLGQVHFRIGASERKVDLDGAIAAISEAVSGFFVVEKKEVKAHG
jgi:flagellar biosynthesis/type III secretory pathway protein FliH